MGLIAFGRRFGAAVLVVVSLTLIVGACAPRQKAKGTSFADQTRGLTKKEGFFDLYIDPRGGRVLARFPEPGDDGVAVRMIYANALTAGLGSNPVGLDRGLTTRGAVLRVRQVGNRAIFEVENSRYRASADNPAERESVAASFARSQLWAGPVLTTARNGDLLVDMSGFLQRDSMDIAGQLKARGQGAYALVADLSYPDTTSMLAFPDNVEMDATLTFSAQTAGGEVARTAADGRQFSLTMHHSFVRLPPEGFVSRAFDPRVAAIDVGYYDFSADLAAPVKRAFARRFRVEREDPSLASGPVKKPLIFYVDRGAPEPIRSALIDGASWWADAFEEAGLERAFRVEILPEDAHPMDVRYNVIQWTHRQTRGWSYGGGVYDPRTGEMLKAHVILGSQRVRQDRMIFEGLAGTAKTGSGAIDDPIEIALARIRQLSAHEVGHTLGFAHNFAASTNDRASVMDYPAPDIQVTEDGALDFSTAYASGIGIWDKFTVKWLYSTFSPDITAEERQRSLDNMVDRAYGQGLRFVADRHGRSVGAPHAHGAVWDNGDDPVAALATAMAVRQIALRNFDIPMVRNGTPRARLREVLVPVYLYHRYQVAAAAKLIGGYDFTYAKAGDGLSFSAPVAPARQREAIAGLLKTLEPKTLSLPERILVRLAPAVGSFNGGAGSEEFASGLGDIFDPLSAADAAATATLTAMLEPTRLARLIETHRRNGASPSYEELLAALEIAVFAEAPDAKLAPIARRVQTRFLLTLMNVNRNPRTSPEVQAETDAYLLKLQGRLSSGLDDDNRNPAKNHRGWLLSLISEHLNQDMAVNTILDQGVDIPPGSPIGSQFGNPQMETCWHCRP